MTGLLLAMAAPAQAHATLIDSDPAEGAVLPEAPEQVTFTFNEAVGTLPGGVKVFDAQGKPIESSATSTGKELVVELPDTVEDGTLVVVWRIISDDGHPVSGSLRFSVGAPSETVGTPEVDTGAARPPLFLELLRPAGYISLLLAAGLVAFLLLVLPADEAAAPTRARLVRLARIAAGVTAAVWVVSVPAVATYQLGGGLGLLGDGSTWSAVSLTEYVIAAVVALGILTAAFLVGRPTPDRGRRVLTLLAGALAAAAPAFSGHTRGTDPELLVVGVDVLHLFAGSVWFGGLVALALTLVGLADRPSLTVPALARFSTIAAGVLAVLVATGAVMAWRILGSWDALVSTSYGRLLIAKVVVVLIVVLIAAWNRFALLPRLSTEELARPDREATTTLVTRSVRVEAALIAVVLVLTGLLVDRSPDVPAASAEPVVETTTLGPIEVKATVTSPVPGPSAINLELFDGAGAPTEGYEPPRASLSSGALDLGELELRNTGPGVYTASTVFPSAGEWNLKISLRTGEFDNPVSTVTFTVEDAPSAP